MTETTTIRMLARAKQEPDTGIIAALESALELARKGELTDLLMITGTNETFDYEYTINSDTFAVTGYTHRVLREIEDISFEV